MSRKRLAVNTRLEFDPDFGSKAISDANAYYVSVVAKSQNTEYHFFMLMPVVDDDELQLMLKDVLGMILENDDFFEVRVCDQKDITKWSTSTPLVSFNPDAFQYYEENSFIKLHDVFFWLMPPKKSMH